MARVHGLAAVVTALTALLALATPAQAGIVAAGELFVDLDARQASAGTPVWSNQGTLGDFAAGGDPAPQLLNYGFNMNPAVDFNGSTAYYQCADNAPAGLVGPNPTRSIEVWAYNPWIANEETLVSWGHRGGPCGTNMSFNYGTNASYGAVGQWCGGPDVGWNGTPAAGEWHHLVYTHDGTHTRVYADGYLRNEEDHTGALNTHAGTKITIAAQIEPDGTTITGGLKGSLGIANVRIHDGVLSHDDIINNYNEDAVRFGLPLYVPPPPPPTPAPTPAGAIADWQFSTTRAGATVFDGQSVGNTLRDEVGTSTNHQIIGDPQYAFYDPAEVGRIWADGYALNTRVGEHFPWFPYDDAFRLNTDQSVWARFKLNGGDNEGTVVGRPQLQNWRLRVNAAGQLEAIYNNQGDIFGGAGPAITPGLWYDVGMAFQGSGAGGTTDTVNLYLNGVRTNSVTGDYVFFTDDQFHIGDFYPRDSLDALFDRVIFWNSAVGDSVFGPLSDAPLDGTLISIANSAWNLASTWTGGPPPTPTPDTAVIVDGETVTVAAPGAARMVDFTAGVINVNSTLTIGRGLDSAPGTAVNLGPGAALSVGHGTIDQMTTAGDATVASAGELAVATYSDGSVAGRLTKQGDGVVTLGTVSTIAGSAFQVDAGTLVASGANPLGAAGTLTLNGGTFRARGAPEVPANSALAYFSFDNAANLAEDTSNINVDGRDYSGTLMDNGGGLPVQVPGQFGGAIDFERDNANYIDLPDGFDDFSNGVTVAAWVNYESFTTWNRIVDLGNGAAVDNIVLARRGGSDDIRWEFFGTAGGTETHDVNDLLPNNQWIHIAATTEPGGTNTSLSTIYINGTPVHTKSDSTVPRSILRTQNYIAESNWGGDDYTDGRMDELYIFNYALTADQVATLRDNGQFATGLIDMRATQIDVTASSALEAVSSHTALFGPVTLRDGTALTTRGADMSFESLAVSGPAGRRGTIAPENTLDVGTYNDGGIATTLVKGGSATLTLDSAKLSAAATTFEVAQGTLAASGADPLGGSSSLTLAGGTFSISDHLAPPAPGPVNGLVARYSFDNPADLAHDDSGNGWNGVLFGDTRVIAGKVGAGAAEFDGSGDYVLLPDDVKGACDDITVATWVWTDDTDTWQRAWDFGTGTGQYIMYAPYGVRRFVSKNLGGEQVVNPQMLTTGQWYHVACVLEGDLGTVYVDGTKAAENPAITINPSDFGGTQNYLGRSQYADPYLDGRLDELYIYNRALSAGEIGAMAGTRTPADMSAVDVLVAASSRLHADSAFTVPFRDLTLNDGTALVTTGSPMTFQSLSVAGGPGRRGTIAPENALDIGAYNDGGVATTLVKGGSATLALDGAKLTAGATTFEVAQGTLAVAGANALGGSRAVTLSGGTLSVGDELGPPGPGPADHLVAHWAFDDAPGSLWAVDAAGNYDGWLIGDTAFVPDGGKVGGALHFGGASGFVQLNQGMNAWDDGFSVAGWVNTEAFTNWARVIDFGNGAGVDNILLARRGTSDDLRFEVHDGIPPGGSQLNPNDVYVLNEWQHLAATIADDHTARVYLNGVEIASGTMTLPTNVLRTNNYIGESNWPADAFFQGVMDELYIYNRALTPAEVLNMVAQRTAPDVSSVDVLVTADSTLRSASLSDLAFNTLTMQSGVFTTTGTSAMSFAGTTLAPGASAVGLNTEVDTTLGALDGNANIVAITKTGPARLILNQPAVNLQNATVNVHNGVLVTSADTAVANLAMRHGGTVDTGAGSVTIGDGGTLSYATTTMTTAGGALRVSGSDLASGPEWVTVFGGTVAIDPGSPPPSIGLVAHWAFDGSAADSTGTYNGTLIGDTSFVPDGKVGGALHFGGASGYVDLPDGMNSWDNGFSVAGWVNTEAFTNWARVIDFGNGAGVDNILLARIGTGDDLRFEVHDGIAPGGASLSPGDVYVLNQWQHLAATIAADHSARVYLNGVEIASGSMTLPTNVTRTNNYIGESNWPADAFFQGVMDDLYIYNRGLTPEEVGSLYGNGVGPSDGIAHLVNVGGTGSILSSGPIMIASSLAPGTDLPGALSIDADLTFEPGSAFAVDIRGLVPGTGYDQLVFGGDLLELNGALLEMETLARSVALEDQVTLVNILNGGVSATGLFTNPRTMTLLNEGDLVDDLNQAYRWAISYQGGTGNDIVLTLKVIPEPGTLSLLALGGLGLLLRRRRTRVS